MVPSVLMAAIFFVSYCYALENDGDITRVSPTAQSVMAPTLITLSPAKAVCVKWLYVVAGAFPWRSRVPLTTINLFPAKMGSM